MEILDDRYLDILEELEDNPITFELLWRKYGYKQDDIHYLSEHDYFEEGISFFHGEEQGIQLSGKAINYLANYRAYKNAEEKEENRWHITKKQAKLGMVIAGVGIIASLVMSILALIINNGS